VNEAARDDYRMWALILGVVRSDAFQMKGGTATPEPVAAEAISESVER